MNLFFRAYLFCSVLLISNHTVADQWKTVGVLGNSGGDGASLVRFDQTEASGIGPVLDTFQTLWERGGAGQLNRYALDGRLLASFPIPESTDRNDQMAICDDLLVLRLNRKIYTLPTGATPDTSPTRLELDAEVMSSNEFEGKVAIYDKSKNSIFRIDPANGELVLLNKWDVPVQFLHWGEDGILYIFGQGKVHALKNGIEVKGFPRDFRGERPRKIGRYWYSHSWHGTINRLNEAFEPEPGVVLGGASGSFIGYLPQSVDLTNGRGIVPVRSGIFAVSGTKGIIQLLKWNEAELRFEVVRRIGGLPQLRTLAINHSGDIWTPLGSARWGESSETPFTLGDKYPDTVAQAASLNGGTLCLLKKHYSNVQLAFGPFIDSSGWSHFESKGISGFELPDSITGTAAVPLKSGYDLVAVERGGKAFQTGLTNDGSLRSNPITITLPGLSNCTSLAWFQNHLIAADSGALIGFQRDDEQKWKEVFRRDDFGGGDIYIHSDESQFVVSETQKGILYFFSSLHAEPVRFEGLKQPFHVAISGNRCVVYESGNQRIVKLERLENKGEDISLKAVQLSKTAEEPHRHRESEFQALTRPGGIPFSIALSEEDRKLHLSVRTPGQLQLGIANTSHAYLLNENNRLEDNENLYRFVLPAGDWSKLKIAAAVRLPAEQERFGFTDHRAIHADFDPNPETWDNFDIKSYREKATERRQEINITFEQPVEGKATLVIETEDGKRVRNLISGRTFAAGRHIINWDGFDEEGKLIEPGTYRWRGITHPGIKPLYRMNFANGGENTTEAWGPNHSTFHSAASNGKLIFFAAPVTEGGWALAALDADGKFVQGYEHQHGLGIQHDAIAADDRYLYCAQDGFAWGGTKGIDFGKQDWTAEWTISVVRYDIKTGKMIEFPGKQRHLEVDIMEVGPGSDHPDTTDFNLGGLAVKDGKLYIGSQHRKAVIVLDAETGAEIDAIPVDGARDIASGKSDIYVATDRGVLRLSDRKTIVPTGEMDISGIALSPDGDLWISDRNSHQAVCFSTEGKQIARLGTPGGPYKGPYLPGRMINPCGLVFGPTGKLWVTENRWNPKRVLAWDIGKKTVVFEKFGMPHYGGDGSGFDPENPRRWIGLGCFWDVDIDKNTARPTSVISLDEGHFGNYHPQSYQFFREEGRTFLCARGKIALISEVLSDGTIRDIAATAGTHHFAYGCDWEPPQSYIDAFYEKWPEKRALKKPMGRKGEGKPWRERGMGVLWVDRNGDGVPQKEEFDFCGDDIAYGDGAWGHLQTSLTLNMPVVMNGQTKIAAISPKGFLKNGIPDYPTLDEAISEATPIDLSIGYKRSGVATVRDSSGRFIFNSDPEMNAYAVDGRHLWSYPNQWSNVHGSHKAPLPEPGVLQGTLGILGLAPFDEEGEVFFMNGNHGRCFMLTTDGLYLDEAFVDVRVSYLKNEYRLGGEIFGGSFGQSKTDGKYYVQIGHGPYRIYEMTGLSEATRISGTLQVTGEQITAAEGKNLRTAVEVHPARNTTVPGKLNWDQNGKFRVEMQWDFDSTHLKLHYHVEDQSPWVNNGRDWTKLFATGDTVDFQFATDPAADRDRRSAAPGDKRLIIAQYEGKPVAVLYDFRIPDEKGNEKPIVFTSPWRAETVDNVVKLSDTEIDVKISSRGYEINASVPLSDLGLDLNNLQDFRADFGVTYGDASGTDTNLRSYWSNRSTGLVDDIPGEIMLAPSLWGTVRAVPESPE